MIEEQIAEYIKAKLSLLNMTEETKDRIVRTCLTDAKNLTRNTDQSTETCNSVALKIAHCVFKEVSDYIGN